VCIHQRKMNRTELRLRLVESAKATSADLDRAVYSINLESGAVYVRKPAPPCMAFGMTYLVAERGALATDVTLHVVRSCFTFVLTIVTIACYHVRPVAAREPL